MIFYWKKLKNGEFRYSGKPFKGTCVKEEILERENGAEGITQHVFTCDDVRAEYTFYCGYDRQVRKQRIIERLLMSKRAPGMKELT